MSIIAPPNVKKNNKLVKTDTNFLKDALASTMREIVVTEDGRQMTVAQAGAERLKNIFLYAESNTDSIAAGKLIFERLYGKAAIEKVENTQEMPKVIFALQDAGVEKLNEIAKTSDSSFEENNEEPLIQVTTDDGKEYLV